MTEIWKGVDHLTGRGNLPDVTTTYYHGDQLGSARLITTEGGWPIWSATYTPFGYETSAQSTTNNYKFAGMERDSESGLDHTMFRQYSPRMGRWTSPDPYDGSMNIGDPQSMNRYAYVGNDPVDWNDPLGLFRDNCPNGDCRVPKPMNEAWHHNIRTLYKRLKEPAEKVKKFVCDIVPDGKVLGVGGALGGIGSTQGSLEIVQNFNTLDVSGFASGGVQGGWNGGAQGYAIGGYIWGLGKSNESYQGGYTSANFGGSEGVGVFATSSSGGLKGNPTKTKRPLTTGVTVGGTLIPFPTGNVGAGHYSSPLNLGKFLPVLPDDQLLTAIRQICSQ